MHAPPRIGFLGAGLIATIHSKMLRRSGAAIEASDAVYVCSWTSEHPRLVAAAAERGVHVFCEKPLGVDLATAESVLDTVTTAGIVHQVGARPNGDA